MRQTREGDLNSSLCACYQVTAKCLRDAGHEVVVFEKASSVGGIWNYDDHTNTDASLYAVIGKAPFH